MVTKNDNSDARLETGRVYFLQVRYIILLSVIPLAIAFASGVRWLVPLFITVPSYLVMLRWLRQGKVIRAYLEMLLSCLWMSLTFIMLFIIFPDHTAKVVINGPEYVEDMTIWIRTGGGTEGTPALFIPQHLEHMGILILASLITGGAAALFFGAIQMGYMNYYVAWLITTTHWDPIALGLAWPLWSVIRVMSFVLIAVVLGQPLIHGFRFKRFDARLMLLLFGAAVLMEIVDLMLKTVIGPLNQGMLHKVYEAAMAVGAVRFAVW